MLATYNLFLIIQQLTTTNHQKSNICLIRQICGTTCLILIYLIFMFGVPVMGYCITHPILSIQMETASWEKPVLWKFSTAPYAHGTRDQWLWLQSQVLHPVEYTVEQSGRHLSSFPSSKHQMRTISRKNGSIHPAGVCKYKETPQKTAFTGFSRS